MVFTPNLQDLYNKGPVWFSDDAEFLSALEADQIIGLDPASVVSINDAISTREHMLANPELGLADAIAAAVERVRESDEFVAHAESLTSQSLARLTYRFAGSIPQALVMKLAPNVQNIWEQENLDTPSYSDDDLTELAALEGVFRERLSMLVPTPSYIEDLIKIGLEVFANYKPYLLIRIPTLGESYSPKWGFEQFVVSETTARVLKTGVVNFLLPGDRTCLNYSQWRSVAHSVLAIESPQLLKQFLIVWPDQPLLFTGPTGDWDTSLEMAAAIYAAMLHSGLPDDAAWSLILPIFHYLIDKTVPFETPIDQGLRSWLWKLYLGDGVGQFTIPENLANVAHTVRGWFLSTVVPSTLFNSLIQVTTAICEGLYHLLDKLLELIFGVLERTSWVAYSTLVEYFYLARAFSSALLPERRRRPKAVWALLFAQSFTKLSPAEKFALSCRPMSKPKPFPEYHEWAAKKFADLQAIQPEFRESVPIPVRKIRLPKTPMVADEEISALAPLMSETMKTHEITTAWAKTLRDQGVMPGMDGIWWGTDERRVKSISRYDIPRPSASSAIRALAIKSAHALADEFPDIYKGAQYLTPEAAFRKIKVKFSPTLPFIPLYRDKKELQRHGLLDSLVKLTRDQLEQGVHPGSLAHAFLKSDVLSVQKFLDGKNLRTVIAQDLNAMLLVFVSTLETTRRQPDPSAFVMNAVPRSEGGFRDFYDACRAAPAVRQADGKEYDSKLAPVITYDALVELRSIGYEGSQIYNIARSQIEASYDALLHCTMVDLESGDQVKHTGGFMTGQANTSPDNRDSFRMIIIGSWAGVTGKEPSQFYPEGNKIGNAGDDHVVCLKDPTLWEPMMVFVRNHFGVEIITEQVRFEDIDLVGLQPIGVPKSSYSRYKFLGMPVPDYSIASKPSALLLKRTEWKVRVAGFQDVAFFMQHVSGLIGSAYLTCHLPDVYQSLAEEYREEVNYILSRFYSDVSIEESFDEEGVLVSLSLQPGSERERYKGKTANIRKWLKTNRFPNYNDVFRIWVKPNVGKISKMAKDHAKILTWNPSITGSERFLYGLISLREALYDNIPNHVARSLPEFSGEDVTYIMRNPDYMVARFVWKSLYVKLEGKVPSSSMFRTALKENPYGSAEDPVGFYNWLSIDENLRSLMAEDLENLRSRMVIATIFYWKIETLFKATANIPLLSILFNLYILTTRDINRLYSVLNFIYMIATGRSSPIISNMMPPDPFAWVKQLSVILSNAIPSRWQYIPGLRHLVGLLPWAVELWAGADSLVSPRPFRSLYTMMPTPTIWATLVVQLSPIIFAEVVDKSAIVVAPTGTGKSTAFIGAIFMALRYTGTIWLLCPTITARDNYENSFVDSSYIQSLTKLDINVPSRRLKVLTYGHFTNSRLPEVATGDLILFDEMHLVQPEMLRAWSKCEANPRIIITATPRPTVMPQPQRIVHYPGERRFQNQVYRSPLPFVDLWVQVQSRRPGELTRALIVCPTKQKVSDVIMTLGRLSVIAHRMDSDHPVPPTSGVIVATTIVDTAVTIQPPPTCLIDLGQMLDVTYTYDSVFPQAKIEIVATSPSVNTQRIGRVGRSSNSVAYLLNKAGLNEELPLRPTAFQLLSDKSSQSDLLLAYGVTSIVAELNHHPSFYRFLAFSQHLDVEGSISPDVALAIYIFIRLSDANSCELVHDEWLNLRISPSEHEIINIVVADVNDLGYGCVEAGNWASSLALLEGGLIQVVANGVRVSTTCLAVVDRVVVPCGFSIPSMGGHKLVGSLPAKQPHSTTHLWMTQEKFRAPIMSCNSIYPQILGGAFVIVDNVWDEERPTDEPTIGFHHVVQQVSEYLFIQKFRHTRHRVVYVSLEDDTVPYIAPVIYKFRYGAADRSNPTEISFWGYNLPHQTPYLLFALLVACACKDDAVAVIGSVPESVIRLITPGQFDWSALVPYFGRWAVVNPRFARSVIHRAFDHSLAGTLNQYLSTLPILICHDTDQKPPNALNVGFNHVFPDPEAGRFLSCSSRLEL